MCVWAFLVAQTVKNLSAMQETWVQSLGWEDSMVKGVRLPGEFHGLYSLGLTVPLSLSNLSKQLCLREVV